MNVQELDAFIRRRIAPLKILVTSLQQEIDAAAALDRRVSFSTGELSDIIGTLEDFLTEYEAVSQVGSRRLRPSGKILHSPFSDRRPPALTPEYPEDEAGPPDQSPLDPS